MNETTSELSMSFEQRYEILSSIGNGGMGEVFLAKDNLLKRKIALKLIHKQLSTSTSVKQCFNREARAFSLLHHPNIIEIYDFGITQSEQIYITTEYIHGISLHDLFQTKLNISTICDIIIQLLDALNYTHARGLVHCDIKAENVLIGMHRDKLQPKLTDFGLVYLPAIMGDSFTNEQCIGTPAYMAPEQILNQTVLIGPQSDIYEVGVLLYEMLSGQLPYDRETPSETMQAHLHEPIPDIKWQPHLSDLSEDIKSRLSQIVNTALAKKPWKRFISAGDFKQSLVSIQLPEETSHLDSGILEKLRNDTPSAQTEIQQNTSINSISAKIRAIEETEDPDDLLASQSLSFAARRLIFQNEDEPPCEVPASLSEALDLSRNADSASNDMSTDIDDHSDDHPAGERQKEFNILKKYAARALNGKGTFCLLSGKFGTGKTRLLRIFSEKVLQNNLCVFISSCNSSAPYKTLNRAEDYGHFLMYNLFQQLSAQTYVDHQTSFTIRDSLIKEKLWQPDDDETCSRLAKFYSGTNRTSNRSEEEFWQKVLILLSKMIQEAACISPVCLIIDDVQRCDYLTWKWMLHIHMVAQKLPLLAIVCYDPSELSGPQNKLHAHQKQEFAPLFANCITLNPLSEQTIVHMLKTGWHIDPALGRRIADASYGNPYYAVARIQHLGQTGRLQKNRQKLFSLHPDDDRPLGVPSVVIQFFQQKLNEIANAIGSESDLYREILMRLSVFGHEMNMSELEMFWRQETDAALMDCWREAIATWCDHGILTMIKHPQSDTMIQFTEPWHVEIIQSMINPARLKALYLQAALALIDCYENPTMYQAWHIAELMEKANETSAFFQYFQQTIELAYREAQLHFGSECIKHLIQILKKYTTPFSQDIICAVDWPYTLELCADICLRLDDYDQFNYLDKMLQHLTQDKNIYTAMHAYLQATSFLRRNNIQRAQESADSAAQVFESCNEDAQAAKARIIKAEAAMRTGDYNTAKQQLAKAQPILSAQNIYWHVARIENMLALTDWFSGQLKHAERHIQQSLQLFRLSRYKLDLCQVQAHASMMDYFSTMDVKQIAELKELLEILESQEDTQILAKIKVLYYLACVLADQWNEIEEASKLYADIEHIGPHDSIIAGTITCFMAMKNAIQGNPAAARNDITMSIASFGPQNRRARAWCHTLLGTIDILDHQMNSGKQSFQRAEKDFQLLDDQFGLISVKIAQSALLISCKNTAQLWPSALETLHDAKSSPWPIMTTLAKILFIQAAMETSQPASILNMLQTDQPAVVPEVFRPFCIDILANAIAHYSEDKPSETQYLFQLYEAISPEADLMVEDNDFPEVDIF